MKYQANNTLALGAEWTFHVYKRWHLDAFSGAGWAFPAFSDLKETSAVINYGLGFRYLIARRYGILTGLDFAWTNKGDFAFYLVFGNAWSR